MRAFLSFWLGFLALLAYGNAIAKVQLATAVNMPNVVSWKVDDVEVVKDRVVLRIEFSSPVAANHSYSPTWGSPTWDVVVQDDQSMKIDVYSASGTYWDKVRILPGGPTNGAASAIVDAMDAAVLALGSGSTRRQRDNARLAAAEAACLSTGVCGAGMAGTQSLHGSSAPDSIWKGYALDMLTPGASTLELDPVRMVRNLPWLSTTSEVPQWRWRTPRAIDTNENDVFKE